jgi:hypothetical protein
VKSYSSLLEVLTDKQPAKLGDAYINLVYSLALSEREGRPDGTKVKGTILAEALRKAGLRKLLPSRIDKHVLSDAAEAVIVYAWLQNLFTLKESVEILVKPGNLEDGLALLLLKAKDEIMLSGLFPVPC